MFQDSSNPYPWPLFSRYPIPDYYICQRKPASGGGKSSKLLSYIGSNAFDISCDVKTAKDHLTRIQSLFVSELKDDVIKVREQHCSKEVFNQGSFGYNNTVG